MAAAASLGPAAVAVAAAAVPLLLIGAIAMPAAEAQVVVMGAYNETCPQAEDVTKGPFIPLPTGRRDGNRSVADDVALFSPAPDANITDIINLFAIRFNLTAKDVAVLSGMLLVSYISTL
ncbi:unnamed protein product [Miscanthus lutarioriparius]|uniref:Plant heme peroxidase family profile domain-containing protein n=1 Tax=Miscanthus lutarioriparius TaxID=422564 RepID=A0A811NP41_9POAL|nr:unnamed protein product [Miscanthus lutarioriparius]